MFNDKLLISSIGLPCLFIYSREGHHLSSVSTMTTINRDLLCDATWTPRGNIVYTTGYYNQKVVVMSESGKVISTHKLVIPLDLSVCNDDIIYLADVRGVFQSTDDGVSWNRVFKPDGWDCEQVIKVTTDYSDDYWTLGQSGHKHYLRVYSVDRRRSDGIITWRDINITRTDDKLVALSGKMSYDGNKNIFLSDYHNKTVHVLSVNGQCHFQPFSSHYFKVGPLRLAVDSGSQQLYVGQEGGVVEVFKLNYGEG